MADPRQMAITGLATASQMAQGRQWLRGGRASPPTSFAAGAGYILRVASIYICL